MPAIRLRFLWLKPRGRVVASRASCVSATVLRRRTPKRFKVALGTSWSDGIFGFGGSAHVTIQVARHYGCEVFVFSRGGKHREHAEALGASWVGDSFDRPPQLLDGAILFAPAGELVPVALATLDRGANLAIAGIHLSDVPNLSYERHLFQERGLCSVTANTRQDGAELLALAAQIPIRATTRAYALDAANEALSDLKADRLQGAAVLLPSARATQAD